METINPLTRAENLINDLNEEILVTNIDRELDEKLTQSIENGQREYILKEKVTTINRMNYGTLIKKLRDAIKEKR